MIDSQNCYAKHKNDVGKISTPFRIRIKDICKLQTQRPFFGGSSQANTEKLKDRVQTR